MINKEIEYQHFGETQDIEMATKGSQPDTQGDSSDEIDADISRLEE